jgi:hypothetical protein
VQRVIVIALIEHRHCRIAGLGWGRQRFHRAHGRLPER